MKPARISLAVLLFSSFVFIAADSSYAFSTTAVPDRVEKFDIGFNVAGAINSGDLDDSIFLGGNLSYGVTPWIALGVEAGWQNTDTTRGDVDLVPILGDIIIRVPLEDHKFVPYGVIGFGALGAFPDNGSPSDESEWSFAVKLGVGVDWFINDNWIFNVEAAWVTATDDVDLATGQRETPDFWLLGAGVKYLFE